ncbi:YSC84-related protein [Paraburkholderia sp. SARCC-3016]|uniref:lipid-binding SYLF domain-containing protein n=1 Tax=Paraburkholderia sp. SARCC-3016 TaxID=3058611 RepID=UPI002808BDB3|nr:YSC84-related protein [Paraburkholderia sp. SARCC-3016]MDQ7979542.1 YSC84-related protein [Paraburkholderia sp. SARCC-3016]
MLKQASVIAVISGLAALSACKTDGSMNAGAAPGATTGTAPSSTATNTAQAMPATSSVQAVQPSRPAQPLAVAPPPKQQLTTAEKVLDADSRAAVYALVSNHPKMDDLAHKAKGVLIFPNVVRAGFLGGVTHGTGELIEDGRVSGYYATTSLSYGFQAGVQRYAYAMLFMTDAALNNLKTSDNFEIGMGPTVVVVDEGAAKNFNTETAKSDVYAMVFDQRGLMAGTALRGTKISRISQ